MNSASSGVRGLNRSYYRRRPECGLAGGAHLSCNDLSANGAEPVGVLPTLMLPESASEDDIRGLMAEINSAASSLTWKFWEGTRRLPQGSPT